jgi:hypothetical protein
MFFAEFQRLAAESNYPEAALTATLVDASLGIIGIHRFQEVCIV